VFANLSLLENSTGFYQATKLLSSPVLIVWQWVFFGISTDYREVLSLIPLMGGIALITVSDLNLNILGIIFAAVQLLAAAAVQTWVKAKQITYGLSATELLLSNSLICFFLTIPAAPFVDWALLHRVFVWQVPISAGHILVIISSGCLALGMNIACFLIIGIADPLTFQVVGYFKTLLVFIGGAYMFHEGWAYKKVLGIAVTVVGLIVYRHVRRKINVEERLAELAQGHPEEKEIETEGPCIIHEAHGGSIGAVDEIDCSALEANQRKWTHASSRPPEFADGYEHTPLLATSAGVITATIHYGEHGGAGTITTMRNYQSSSTSGLACTCGVQNATGPCPACSQNAWSSKGGSTQNVNNPRCCGTRSKISIHSTGPISPMRSPWDPRAPRSRPGSQSSSARKRKRSRIKDESRQSKGHNRSPG